ncbi:hypothetical protein ACJ41O_000215 [Fusarium nematophilum]
MATTPDDIPTFRIDIARAPEDRYVDVAAAFGPRIRTLGHVFDELLESMLGSVWLARIARFAARLFLRRVHDEEQTREIRGKGEGEGEVDAFPDAGLGVGSVEGFGGCAGVCGLVQGSGSGDCDVGYLCWLRGRPHGRQNLSISLNYRPLHLCDNSHLKKHQLLVILGFRPSVSSIIRKTLFAQQDSSSLVEQAKTLAAVRSAPCYLTLCDGSHAVVVEKDLVTGRIREDDRFIVQTNHDSSEAARCGAEARSEPLTPHPVLWLRDSSDRMDVIHGKWTLHCQVDGEDAPELVDGEKRAVSEEVLREWMVDERISNGFTHFACIMDPLTGRVPWLRRGPAPEVKSVEDYQDVWSVIKNC